MSVYTKLQSVRSELHQLKLKKSGKNGYANYDYFELSDFLPAVQQLNAKHGVCPVFSQGSDVAKLTIIDCDDPASSIVFTIPVAECTLSGKPQPIQNLGAQQTYLRRYLYVAAYEISENDALEATTGAPEPNTPAKSNKTAQKSTTDKKTSANTSKRVEAQEKPLDASKQSVAGIDLDSAKEACRREWERLLGIGMTNADISRLAIEATGGKKITQWNAVDYMNAAAALTFEGVDK